MKDCKIARPGTVHVVALTKALLAASLSRWTTHLHSLTKSYEPCCHSSPATQLLCVHRLLLARDLSKHLRSSPSCSMLLLSFCLSQAEVQVKEKRGGFPADTSALSEKDFFDNSRKSSKKLVQRKRNPTLLCNILP